MEILKHKTKFEDSHLKQHTNDQEFQALEQSINQVKQRSTNILSYHFRRQKHRDQTTVDSFGVLAKTTQPSRQLRPISFDKFSNDDSKDLYKEVKKALISESIQ